MLSPTPEPDDPLAALAKATEKAVRSEDASRVEKQVAREAATTGTRRLVRAVSIVGVLAILAAALVTQGPRMIDPYHGDDPFADPQRAKAYLAGLLDEVSAYRARNGGALPTLLEQAVPESRLLPAGSAYRLEYRIESEAPILTLRGGREPVTMRGPGR